MITTPIQHKALKSMKDVMRWTYRIHSMSEEKCVAKTVAIQKRRAIMLADEAGCIYVTPYRPEIRGILEKAGYTYTNECTLLVPFSGSEVPTRYKWLEKIAEEENWASTYEKAAQVANQKGIKPVKVGKGYSIREISSPYYDRDDKTIYIPMIEMYLDLATDKNVGTYVLVNEHTLVVCDEYGRTFILKNSKGVYNMVNSIINAGYTRMLHPEYNIIKIKLLC